VCLGTPLPGVPNRSCCTASVGLPEPQGGLHSQNFLLQGPLWGLNAPPSSHKLVQVQQINYFQALYGRIQGQGKATVTLKGALPLTLNSPNPQLRQNSFCLGGLFLGGPGAKTE
jgi:hypothetical protein